MSCPRCGRDAPVVQRGLMSYCTVCGAERLPLSAPAVNLAGEPSRIGGCLAKTVGWLVLGVGTSVAAFLGLLIAWLFPGSAASYVVSVPIAILTLVFGGLLVFGGKRLKESGQDARRATQERALTSLAASRGGWLSARRAAHSLSMDLAEADALLTDMAKRRPDEVSVELDEDGQIRYLFSAYARGGGRRLRFESDEPGARPQPSARVDLDVDAEVEAEAEVEVTDAPRAGAPRPSR